MATTDPAVTTDGVTSDGVTIRSVTGPGPGAGVDNLLLEDGFNLLQEDGDVILLE